MPKEKNSPQKSSSPPPWVTMSLTESRTNQKRSMVVQMPYQYHSLCFRAPVHLFSLNLPSDLSATSLLKQNEQEVSIFKDCRKGLQIRASIVTSTRDTLVRPGSGLILHVHAQYVQAEHNFHVQMSPRVPPYPQSPLPRENY